MLLVEAMAIILTRFIGNSYLMTSTGRQAILLLLIVNLLFTTKSSWALQPATLGVHIVRSPESAVAPNADEVVFECELNLTPERLQWRFRHNSQRTIDGSNYHYLHVQDGFNITNEDRTSKLRVFVQPDTLGDYQCVAWFGSAAIASTSASLTLVSITVDNPNTYNRNPARWNVAPKNCVLIRCGTVSSNPPAIWSFYRNGEKLPQTEALPTAGAMVINSIRISDSGNYSCSATNPITGQVVNLPQQIDLRVEYSDRTAPYFLTQPAMQVTARPGDTVVLECPGLGSPPPMAVWSSPNVINMNNNRTRQLSHGLQIVDVVSEDQGSYVCRLDNGIAPALVHIVKFTVLERPKILRGPASTLTNESETLELECSATGNPYPDIYWLINGVDTSADEEMLHDGRRLVIQHIQKRHAGIVQCFAKNEVGEVSEANLLKVNPKQIHGSAVPLGNVPVRSMHEHYGNKNKGKKKHRTATMTPPSRPNVTRLSDDSVMLRWYVPKNDGLPIQFFKVQYRMLGGGNSHKIPRENWQTTNDDILFGKRNRNSEEKNFTTSVIGLKPDRYYKFRIIAVYSNNDNRESNTSVKFFLQRGESLGISKSNLPIPELNRAEAITTSAIMLHWTLPQLSTHSELDGFYAYYRPTSSAGEYLKATVDGAETRKFKIDMLETATAYEFKLQSFNKLTASEFSAIIQGKTKKPSTSSGGPVAESIIPANKAVDEENSIYPVVAGAAGGGILLLIATIIICLCLRKRKTDSNEEENKPQLDHMQTDFVTPQVLAVSPHHKNGHRLNGVLPRMNITANPLAQDGDKNRNVMELHFMASSNKGAVDLNTNINTNTNTNINRSYNYTNGKIPNSFEKLPTKDIQHNQLLDSPQLTSLEQRTSSSSCETLPANDGIITPTLTSSPQMPSMTQGGETTMAKTNEDHSPLTKPLPPLPTKNSSSRHTPHIVPGITPTMYLKIENNNTNHHLNNPQATLNSHAHQHQHPQHYHQHHPAQPIAAYYQIPGTPSMGNKRDYQRPPPVPPHQSPNHITNLMSATNNHLPPLTPSLEHQRKTLERNAGRNLHCQTNINDTVTVAMDNLPTRIPSLRRTRRPSGNCTSNGNSNNVTGSVGIPINSSPRVQRSPMPVRAALIKQRNRLGSHNDNISSGSLNSIEV